MCPADNCKRRIGEITNGVAVEGSEMDNRMRLVIGYDGSDSSNAALHDLKRAESPDETDVIVISVSDLWRPPSPQSSLCRD